MYQDFGSQKCHTKILSLFTSVEHESIEDIDLFLCLDIVWQTFFLIDCFIMNCGRLLNKTFLPGISTSHPIANLRFRIECACCMSFAKCILHLWFEGTKITIPLFDSFFIYFISAKDFVLQKRLSQNIEYLQSPI